MEKFKGLKAEPGKFSSVLGQSVHLKTADGRHYCQLTFVGLGQTEPDYKQACADLSQWLSDLINAKTGG